MSCFQYRTIFLKCQEIFNETHYYFYNIFFPHSRQKNQSVKIHINGGQMALEADLFIIS